MRFRLVKMKGVLGMHGIIPFQKRKLTDIEPYFDTVKGWKFTEDDKEFLLNIYEEYLQFCMEEAGGDFAEGTLQTINRIKENGVGASRDKIQGDAENYALGFGSGIYAKFSDSPDILRFIENSIIDVQWQEG